MKMKPILFNTEMVRAILEGRKTVTRRVLKPHNYPKAKRLEYRQGAGLWFDNEINAFDKDTHIKDYSISSSWIGTQIYIQKYAPYRPGDILYVRETWQYMGTVSLDSRSADQHIYKASWSKGNEQPLAWRPAIYMPREAARIFLRVTDVRVERLQEITEDQAIAEGFEAIKCDHPFGWPCIDCMNTGYYEPATLGFLETWDSTIKKADRALYCWDANPWVWVIEFERITREEEIRHD